jgi:periplasmic protein TonB
MFEQSVVAAKHRPWTMAVSLTLQCAIVAAVILWSVLHVETLGPVSLPDPSPPLRRGKAVKVVDVQRAASAAPTRSAALHPKVFAAPIRIQSAAVALASISDAPAVGVSYMVGAAEGVMNSIVNSADRLTGGIVPAIATRISPPAAAIPEPTPARRIGGDVLDARILERILPAYPALARQLRVSGVVQLAGIIDRDGRVKSLQVISGHPLLVKAAVEAVQKWRYRPTLLNGEPVEVMAPILVNFSLVR